jgi:hypothetical protein
MTHVFTVPVGTAIAVGIEIIDLTDVQLVITEKEWKKIQFFKIYNHNIDLTDPILNYAVRITDGLSSIDITKIMCAYLPVIYKKVPFNRIYFYKLKLHYSNLRMIEKLVSKEFPEWFV